MASLTGTQIANTYKQLLQVGSGNVGLGGTLQTVQDGSANNSPLQLSTNAVNINGAFQLSGVTLTASASTLNAVADLTGATGLVAVSAGNVYGRTLVAGTGIIISNADGTEGNPTIAMVTATTSGSYKGPNDIEVNAVGQIVSISPAVSVSVATIKSAAFEGGTFVGSTGGFSSNVSIGDDLVVRGDATLQRIVVSAVALTRLSATSGEFSGTVSAGFFAGDGRFLVNVPSAEQGTMRKLTSGTGINLTIDGVVSTTIATSGTVNLNANQSFGIVSATNIDADELLMAGVSAANVTEVAAVSVLTSVNLAAITSINSVIGDGTGFVTDAELAAVSVALATSIGNSNTRITSVSDYAVALSATMATSIGNSNTNITINANAITSINSVIGDGTGFVTDAELAAVSATLATSIGNSNTTIAAVSVLTSVNLAAITSITAINTQDVTLTGTPDYITISNQVITRNQIDLTADVTGNLPVGNLNAGTGASGTAFWRGDGVWAIPSGAGDVIGPASATDNAVVRFDATTGKLIQNSGVLITDGNEVTATGFTGTLDGVLGGGTPAAITGTALTLTTGATVTTVLDEDNMASNSATALSTQQSIKAYVDAQVGTADTLSEVLALGNTTGGTDIAMTGGDKITNFESTGINDDAASTALTIDANGDMLQSGGGIKVSGSLSSATTNSISLDQAGAVSRVRTFGPSVGNAVTIQFEQADSAGTPIRYPLVINSSGNVGIGTTAPTQKFQIHGNSGGDVYARITNTDSSTSSGLLVGLNGNEDGIIRVETNAALIIGTNNTERMRILSTGNVGIGTTAPDTTLHVQTSDASATGTGDLVVENVNNAGINILAGTVYDAGIYFGDSGSATIGRLVYNNTSNNMQFWTNGAERMRIDSGGNVGIGTSSPDAPLTVYKVAAQNIAAHLSSTSGAILQFTDQGSKDWGFGLADGTSALTFFEDRNPDTAGTARMTVASGGNVGIGTASPAKQLTITKSALATINTLTDGATITPDFDAGQNFSVTLAGNRTLANPTNIDAGQTGSIFITQDGTGSRTLSFGSYWDFAGGTAPTLSTAAASVDRIDYIVRTGTSIHAVATLNLS